MVETVECICQVVDVGADLVWCHFFESIFHHTVELACFQHQCFFAGICRYTDLSVADIIACCLIFVQDGLDTYDGVQNIWAWCFLQKK